MSAYTFPIKITFFLFPFLALVISLPLFIIQYRKYGKFTWFRGLILYSFIFYLLCAYFLVILPLPPREEVATYTSQIIELRPFMSLRHFLAETVLDFKDPSTFLPALQQSVALEPLFNILLFMPFGFYLRYYFKCSFKKTLILSLCLSLFFELTQLSGLYFIYPRPYRLADVNDLIHNTLGGILGYVLAPLLAFFLPSRQKIDDRSYELGKRVTFIRRGIAFLIDYFIVSLIAKILIFFLNKLADTHPSTDTIAHWLDSNMSAMILLLCIYFISVETLFSGKTVGKALVRIQVKTIDQQPANFKQLFIRNGCLYIYPLAASIFYSLFSSLVTHDPHPDLLWIYLSCFFAGTGLFLGWSLTLAIEILKKRPQLYYETFSHTLTRSTVINHQKKEDDY